MSGVVCVRGRGSVLQGGVCVQGRGTGEGEGGSVFQGEGVCSKMPSICALSFVLLHVALVAILSVP